MNCEWVYLNARRISVFLVPAARNPNNPIQATKERSVGVAGADEGQRLVETKQFTEIDEIQDIFFHCIPDSIIDSMFGAMTLQYIYSDGYTKNELSFEKAKQKKFIIGAINQETNYKNFCGNRTEPRFIPEDTLGNTDHHWRFHGKMKSLWPYIHYDKSVYPIYPHYNKVHHISNTVVPAPKSGCTSSVPAKSGSSSLSTNPFFCS